MKKIIVILGLLICVSARADDQGMSTTSVSAVGFVCSGRVADTFPFIKCEQQKKNYYNSIATTTIATGSISPVVVSTTTSDVNTTTATTTDDSETIALLQSKLISLMQQLITLLQTKLNQ